MNIERAEGDPFDRRALLECVLLFLVALGIAFAVLGCATIPPMEICYISKYGPVCIHYDGTRDYPIGLTFEQKKEIDDAIENDKVK